MPLAAEVIGERLRRRLDTTDKQSSWMNHDNKLDVIVSVFAQPNETRERDREKDNANQRARVGDGDKRERLSSSGEDSFSGMHFVWMFWWYCLALARAIL